MLEIIENINLNVEDGNGGGSQKEASYNDLTNKPSINNILLSGNKTSQDLGFSDVATSGDYEDLVNTPDLTKYDTIDSVNSKIKASEDGVTAHIEAVEEELTNQINTSKDELSANINDVETELTNSINTVKTYTHYGIKGDYNTNYGILKAPNGILLSTGMNVVLQPGVVLQCAGQEAKTTIASVLQYKVTSTTDIDLFYSAGSLLECSHVFYQEEEPDDGSDAFIAWWAPSYGKWRFKSNDTGNVFRDAIACRLAHIHTDGTNITRIDYIGNRILDDEFYLDEDKGNELYLKKTDADEFAATSLSNITSDGVNKITNYICPNYAKKNNMTIVASSSGFNPPVDSYCVVVVNVPANTTYYLRVASFAIDSLINNDSSALKITKGIYVRKGNRITITDTSSAYIAGDSTSFYVPLNI